MAIRIAILLLTSSWLFVAEVRGDDEQSLISRMISSFLNEPEEIHETPELPLDSHEEDLPLNILNKKTHKQRRRSYYDNRSYNKKSKRKSLGQLLDARSMIDRVEGEDDGNNRLRYHKSRNTYLAPTWYYDDFGIKDPEYTDTQHGRDDNSVTYDKNDKENSNKNVQSHYDDDNSDEGQETGPANYHYNDAYGDFHGNRDMANKGDSSEKGHDSEPQEETSLFDIFGFRLGKMARNGDDYYDNSEAYHSGSSVSSHSSDEYRNYEYHPEERVDDIRTSGSSDYHYYGDSGNDDYSSNENSDSYGSDGGEDSRGSDNSGDYYGYYGSSSEDFYHSSRGERHDGSSGGESGSSDEMQKLRRKYWNRRILRQRIRWSGDSGESYRRYGSSSSESSYESSGGERYHRSSGSQSESSNEMEKLRRRYWNRRRFLLRRRKKFRVNPPVPGGGTTKAPVQRFTTPAPGTDFNKQTTPRSPSRTTSTPDDNPPPMFGDKCEAMLDIVLIVHSSHVDPSQNYTALKCGLVKFVEAMSSPRLKDNIHIGLIQYTGFVQSTYPLTADKAKLKSIIYDMPTFDSNTRAEKALVEMFKMFRDYGRRAVRKVAVLVSYHSSSNPSAVIQQAVRAANEGITMFSVGLTTDVGVGELLAIADSNVERFHIIPRFDDFSEIVEDHLSYDVCKVWSEIEFPGTKNWITKEAYTWNTTTPMPVTKPPAQTTRKPSTPRPIKTITYLPRLTTRPPLPEFPKWPLFPMWTTAAATTTQAPPPPVVTTTPRPVIKTTPKLIVVTKPKVTTPKPRPPPITTPRPVPTTTRKPRPTTTPLRPEIDVCRGCKMLNGAGYNPHPEDCTQFVECIFDVSGDAISFQYEKCPFGLFWNQEILSCDHPNNVNCYNDACRHSATVVYDYGYKTVCSAYWECTEFGAIARCCPNGYSYRPGFGCIIDERCNVTCPLHLRTTPRKPDVCQSRSIPNDFSFYEQMLPGDKWVRMPCPSGTSYDQELCKCVNNGMISSNKQACEPEVVLRFKTDFSDESGKGVWVANEGVVVVDGRARFDGKSRLLINRFTNDDLGETLTIRFKYRSFANDVDPKHRHAILSNGDCGDIGSVVIYEDSAGVYFGVKTTREPDTVLFRMDKPSAEWKNVEFVFKYGILTANINGNVFSMPSEGRIESRACALQIGHGYGFDKFIGEIDDLEVFKCLN